MNMHFILRLLVFSGLISFYCCSTSKNADIVYFASKVQSPIKIDGRKETQWDKSVEEPIYLVAEGTKYITDSTDLYATFNILWDEKNLYLFYTVHDDIVFDVKELDSPYSRPQNYLLDCIELFFDMNNEKSMGASMGADKLDDDYYLWFVSYNEASLGTSTIQYQYEETDYGYNLEIGIPWSYLDFIPETGSKIGFESSLIDNDNHASADYFILERAVIVWSPYDRVNAWQDTGVYGNLVLTN